MILNFSVEHVPGIWYSTDDVQVYLYHTTCYIYIYFFRTCRRHSTYDFLVYILIPYYMLYLFLCRTCGWHPSDDVPVHWDAEEGGPPGVGLQGVPAAVRHDIQVQGQRKANQLHLLPGQENAGKAP